MFVDKKNTLDSKKTPKKGRKSIHSMETAADTEMPSGEFIFVYCMLYVFVIFLYAAVTSVVMSGRQ